MELLPSDPPPFEPGDSPALRLFALLEVIASKERFTSLPALAEQTGLPKATLHRMLQQLETGGLLQRSNDGRHLAPGTRLRRMAEQVLLNDVYHGARHAVLRRLVEELGESCNLTALSGHEVIYLDRAETATPLRFYLHPGSRVPAHSSASGKLLLAQLAPSQRRRLLEHVPLQAHTPRTITTLERLEEELAQVRQQGYALDHEEFLPGLMCVAVLVPSPHGRSNLCVAVQAPILRLDLEKVPATLPALQRAAAALGAIEAQALPAEARENTREESIE